MNFLIRYDRNGRERLAGLKYFFWVYFISSPRVLSVARFFAQSIIFVLLSFFHNFYTHLSSLFPSSRSLP
jgi:hypothetical protein